MKHLGAKFESKINLKITCDGGAATGSLLDKTNCKKYKLALSSGYFIDMLHNNLKT